MECIDISENCRACQYKTKVSQRILIFNTVKLPDIYKETTSLDIHENDGLPKMLCSTCYDRLLEAYNFRKMCFATVLHFQKILSIDVPEENYMLPELQSDLHIDIKPYTDILDVPNSPLRSPSLPLDQTGDPDRDDALSNISDALSIDDKLPEILKTDPDDDAPLSSRQTQKLKEKKKKTPTPQKTMTPLDQDELDELRLIWCGICNSKFLRKSRLEMHMREKHLGLKPCLCKICGKEFGYWAFEFHMRTKHRKKKQFPCPECRNKFNTRMELNRHIRAKHYLENPVRPRKKVNEGETNGKEFNTTSSLRIENLIRKFATPSTGTAERDRPQRSCKQNKLGQYIKKKHECPICGVENDTFGDLKVHVKIHNIGDEWYCGFCPHKAVKKYNVTQHVKIVHLGIREHICRLCDRSFTEAANLRNHLRRHKGIKRFECEYCGIKKTTANEMTLHRNTHTKEKRWSCELCPYETLMQGYLGNHMKSVHQKKIVKNYYCTHCDKSFTTSGTLKDHMTTHTGKKSHACPECGKTFNRPNLVAAHMKRHHKSKSKTKIHSKTASKSTSNIKAE